MEEILSGMAILIGWIIVIFASGIGVHALIIGDFERAQAIFLYTITLLLVIRAVDENKTS